MLRMAMSSQYPSKGTRPRISSYMLRSLVFIITLATVSTPALAGTPPSTFVVYDHQDTTPPDVTDVIVASPSGNLSSFEFGTIGVISNVLRKTEAADSPALGVVDGTVIVEKDPFDYLAITLVLNTDSFAGSISAQGVLSSPGNGELAITGGTYDFRYARGYLDVTFVSSAPEDTVFKFELFIKYD